MKLPKQVQKQVEEAETLEQSIQAAQSQQEPPAPLVADPEPAPQPETDPKPPATTPSEPAPERTETADYWRSRYLTIEGKYNAEVPRLSQQLDALNREVQSLREAAQSAQNKPAPEPEPPKPVMDPKDIETFGADLVEMVQRNVDLKLQQAYARLQTEINPVVRRLEQLEQAVSGVSQATTATREEQFFAGLTAQVPDWEALNHDQGFIHWLAQVDPIYGVPRQNALHHARQSLDLARVASIFNAYKATLAPTKATPEKSLEAQITPSGSATPSPTAPSAAPYYSQAQITQFYNDLARGKYRGKESEAAQIEAQIDRAVAEGRVR